MPRMRSVMFHVCLTVALLTVGTGCFNQDVGVSLLVQPELLNFGLNTDRIVMEVSKNLSETTLEPIVASAADDWITIDKCTDAAEDCISPGPAAGVQIPVRVHRDRMKLGTNSSVIELYSGGASLRKVTVIAEDRLEANFQADRTQAGPGQSIAFRDQSLVVASVGPITGRLWDFGDGTTSIAINPTHAYAQPGLYSVSLTVTTPSAEETRTRAAFVQIGAPQPKVAFTAAPTAIAVQNTVTFTDQTLAQGVEILGRLWDFGDGITSTELNPIHQYNKTGIFTVSLTVDTNFGKFTETKENLIVVRSKVAPTARFTLSQAMPFVNIPVQFSDLSDPGSAPINTRLWDFGDGTFSSEMRPVHAFSSVGPNTVKLTVISADGSDSTTQILEVIFKAPEADFVADDTNPSVFQFVQFNDRSTPGSLPVDTWAWDFGDGGTSGERNPRHRYQLPGTYTVSLEVTIPVPSNNTDMIVKEDYIVVVNPPSPAFTYTVQDNITSSGQAAYTINTIQFNNQTAPGTETPVTFQWDFDGDPATTDDISNAANPVFQFTEAGSYNVTLTASTATRSVSTSQVIVVDQAPVIGFAPSTNMTNVGVQVVFTNTTQAGIAGTNGNDIPIQSQTWDFGDGVSAFNVNASHIYDEVGSYIPRLTIFFNHSGTGLPVQFSLAGAPIIVDIAPPPTAAFSTQGSEGTACASPGQTVNFINESDLSVGTNAQYLWDFGDGSTSTLANPSHVYANAGSYDVSLRVTIEPEFAPRNTHEITVQGAVLIAGDGSSALADYVALADTSFGHTPPGLQTASVTIAGINVSVGIYTTVLTSQTWRSLTDYAVDDTNSADWEHNVTMLVPSNLDPGMDTGLLFISGGSNGSEPINLDDLDSAEELLLQIAAGSQSIVTLLEQVPNEPVTFTDENGLRNRTEDEIIAYTFDEYMRSVNMGAEDATWPLLLPMTKSAVRAMDTVQEMAAINLGVINQTKIEVNNFVVGGASKRGWTTWLTAAVDDRVTGIIPIVIDVLNMEAQMMHHFDAYGYWAPSIYAYAQERIFDRFNGDPAADALLKIVDPFSYRCDLDMPKFILNSTGDQFFLPDSSQFYYDQMPGENYLNYVPNTEHSLDGSTSLEDNASAAESLVSFYISLINNGARPNFSWEFLRNGAIEVTTQTTPRSVTMWQAENPNGRDFRLDEGVLWTSTPLVNNGSNVYSASIQPPAQGYAAFFVQMQFDNPAVPAGFDLPFTFTTPVRVLPETDNDDNLYPDFDGTRTAVGAGNQAVPVITVHGEAREMGEEYGRLMADEINSFIPAFLALAQAEDPALTDAALDAAWDTVVANTDPDFAGPMSRFELEVNGVADGSGVDFDTLRRANMVPVLAALSGSGAAALRSATPPGALDANLFQSASIHWSVNLGLQDNPCIVIYMPQQGGGLPHVNVTFAGLSGVLTGINVGGVAVSSIEDPDQPGDPGALALAGDHYSTFFRELLYDALSRSDVDNRLMDGQLFQRQHLVIGEGRNLGQVVKYNIQAPDALFTRSTDNAPNDEFLPNILPGLVYSATDPGDADEIFGILDTNNGVINTTTMNSVNSTTDGNSTAVLNVVYNADDELAITATYTGRPAVTIDVQDFLP